MCYYKCLDKFKKWQGDNLLFLTDIARAMSSNFYMVGWNSKLVAKLSLCFLAFCTPEFFKAEEAPVIVTPRSATWKSCFSICCLHQVVAKQNMIHRSSFLAADVKLHGVLSGEKRDLLAQVLHECGQPASWSELAHVHTSTPVPLDLPALGLTGMQLACAHLRLPAWSHQGAQVL